MRIEPVVPVVPVMDKPRKLREDFEEDIRTQLDSLKKEIADLRQEIRTALNA